VMYKEPLLLFHHIGKTLENVSASAGPAFGEAYAARGLALGDFNNDGAMDVLVSVNNGSPVLLKNVAARGNHWLGLRLIGKRSNPDAIGARITWDSSAASKRSEAEAIYRPTIPVFCLDSGRVGESTSWRFAGPSPANE
jgi:hypothetical protein